MQNSLQCGGDFEFPFSLNDEKVQQDNIERKETKTYIHIYVCIYTMAQLVSPTNDCNNNNTNNNNNKKQRVLFIGIEFIDPNFSGNGVYSRTIVKSLLIWNKVDVHILCGRPSEEKDHEISISSHDLQPFYNDNNNVNKDNGKLSITAIPLQIWKKLGRYSSWEEFSNNVKTNNNVKNDLEAFKPTVAFGVDWTSYQIFNNLNYLKNAIPFNYFVFRTFSAEKTLTTEEREWYNHKELEAQMNSTSCIVLSKVDRQWNVDKYRFDKPLKCLILNPPLRQDFLQLYNNKKQAIEKNDGKEEVIRNYITCCSRLEPSKCPDRFVDLVCCNNIFLKEHNIVPVLIGSKTDPIYSNKLLLQLQQHFNMETKECLVIGFIKDPMELQQIWERTILNIHPAMYDSYAMTIVEAAAFAAPTLLDTNASIGAEDLLYGDARFHVNMSNELESSKYLKELLSNRNLLMETGLKAQQIAIGWNDKAHAEKMQIILNGQVPSMKFIFTLQE